MARSWPVTFEPNLDSKYFSSLTTKIDTLTAVLRDVPLAPHARAAVDHEAVVRAIRGSCGIEGNSLSEAEIDCLLTDDTAASTTAEARQALNADLVLRQIRNRKPLPLAELVENNVKDLHDLVTLGVDYLDQAPGEYRTADMTVGSYVCPRAIEVPTLMALLTDYLNTGSALTLHPVVRALIAHFYLQSIQPFASGNGRTARAVEIYLLYHGGYSQVGFYSLPAYYWRNRDDYFQELERARFEHNGELRDWVIFGLEGFLGELEERKRLIFDALKKTAWRQHLDDLAGQGLIPGRVVLVLGRLADEPDGLSIAAFKKRNMPWLADIYQGLSERSVRNDLTIMRRLNLVTQANDVLGVRYRSLETPR